eukprot:1588218-Pyramimonas_sp.AAC.1
MTSCGLSASPVSAERVLSYRLRPHDGPWQYSQPALSGWAVFPRVPLHPCLVGRSLATFVGRTPLEKLRNG